MSAYLLRHLDGAIPPRDVELTLPHYRIGRMPDNDIQIQVAGVSRFHAELVKAESIVGTFDEDFGWMFVDKENVGAYTGRLALTWGALLAHMAVLFGLIIVLQMRKDVI